MRRYQEFREHAAISAVPRAGAPVNNHDARQARPSRFLFPERNPSIIEALAPIRNAVERGHASGNFRGVYDLGERGACAGKAATPAPA
jgi:hypothetical protein